MVPYSKSNYYFSHQLVKQFLNLTVVETGRKSHCKSKSGARKMKFQMKLMWEIRTLSWTGNDEYKKDEKSQMEEDCWVFCLFPGDHQTTIIETTTRDGVSINGL